MISKEHLNQWIDKKLDEVDEAKTKVISDWEKGALNGCLLILSQFQLWSEYQNKILYPEQTICKHESDGLVYKQFGNRYQSANPYILYTKCKLCSELYEDKDMDTHLKTLNWIDK